MSNELVLVPRVATEEMKLAGYLALVAVFDEEGCEPNPEDWGRAYTSMIEAFDPITWEVARNQVIQELIEAAKADFLDAQKRREEMSGTSLGLRVDRAKATYEWLKSQMEGE